MSKQQSRRILLRVTSVANAAVVEMLQEENVETSGRLWLPVSVHPQTWSSLFEFRQRRLIQDGCNSSCDWNGQSRGSTNAEKVVEVVKKDG